MLFFATALTCESGPIIDMLGLNRINSFPAAKFPVYANKDAALIITGTGPVRAAAAVASLLAHFQPGNRDTLVNIGVCGTAGQDMSIGEPALCHKIIHHDTKRAYYPDILIGHSLKQKVLETFSTVRKEAAETARGDLFDMEGAGCYEAGSAFLSPHQMLFVKIVSDRLNPGSVKPHHVAELISRNLNVLRELLDIQNRVLFLQPTVLDERDMRLLNAVTERLRLTATMGHELRRLALQYKLSSGNDLSCLEHFLLKEPKTKREGKILFAQIRKQLVHA